LGYFCFKVSGADIVNAYTGVKSVEKVNSQAGPLIDDKDAYAMLILKAPYGLCISGVQTVLHYVNPNLSKG